ncbi:Leucine-rich repeat-containing protein [Artemisia annua]|uniref:Leucine-rich repeat-containing protein n=1 Tax=Artemisia annua TaxID=35608 RepID=A0A2U1KXB3_ARTAN|nr:Leucine-rich repeat-containing protein [Artemisia annua]
MFSGNVPFDSFASPSLKVLYLRNNQLGGQIDVQTFPQLTNLTEMYLSHNNFSGELELDTLLSTLTNLEYLDLSYSGFSVTTTNANHFVNPRFSYLKLASCKLKVFPNSFRAMKQLHYLDLSSNEIHGQIPHWAGEIGIGGTYGLEYLNLSHNFITGLPQFQWYGLEELYLQSNLIEGPFPPSICNMSSLYYLDMSNNSFGGLIPQCFGNISSSLRMIDMGNNSFQGTIPNVYRDCGSLEGLILNGNQLRGDVPISLSKCKSLKVVDFGKNHLNGTFPGWLGALPNLQALVLKSNNFHGRIQPSATVDSPFPSLRVLDLSHNGFVGQLPAKYFQNFNSMKNVVKNSTKPEYLYLDYVYAPPKVYWNLSTTKLLTMEFVEGAEVNDLQSIQKLGINPHDIARLVSRTFAEMMFKHGFVHWDPHAANLLVRTLPSSKRGIFGRRKPQLVLLDHDLYKVLDNSIRTDYAALWKALGFLQWPWNRVIDPAVDHLAIQGNASDHSELQMYASLYFPQITEILHKLPRVIHLMLKTNDCLRSVNNSLIKRPSVESFIIIGRVSSEALIEEKLSHESLFSLLHVWLEEISLEVRFLRMQVALWIVQFRSALAL